MASVEEAAREWLIVVTRLAHRIAAREEDQAQDRRELVEAMKEAYGPHTLQQIGDAAGLSRQRVEQLIKKEEK